MSKPHRRRSLTSIVLTFALLCAMMAVPAFAAETNTYIKMTIGQAEYMVNGESKTLDSAPYVNADDHTMVPIRFLAEATGAEVEWDGTARAATIAYGDVTAVFAIGADTMTINGTEKTIPTAAVIQNNRTMIPLRAAAEAIGAIVTYNDGVVDFVKADAVTVSNFDQLQQAVVSGASTITMENFDTTGETTVHVDITRPLVLDGNGASIDFGFHVQSNGVTIKNLNITTSEWDKAVSANDKDGSKTGGDCVAIEIHNDNTGDPVVVENVTIVHDVFANKNSAIYLADGAYVHILNNNITVENKENNTLERGGIYLGTGVSGQVTGNTIDSARTAFPMSPLGLTANLDAMEGEIAMPAIEVKDNTATSIYVTKMYTNGVLFGEDQLIKADDTDFGVREALEAYLVALDTNNTFVTREGYPAEGEDRYNVCRLDLIYVGAPASEWNIYFDVVDGKLVQTVAPAGEVETPTEGTEAPTEGTETPTEGTETPTEGTEPSTEGTEDPSEETTADPVEGE